MDCWVLTGEPEQWQAEPIPTKVLRKHISCGTYDDH